MIGWWGGDRRGGREGRMKRAGDGGVGSAVRRGRGRTPCLTVRVRARVRRRGHGSVWPAWLPGGAAPQPALLLRRRPQRQRQRLERQRRGHELRGHQQVRAAVSHRAFVFPNAISKLPKLPNFPATLRRFESLRLQLPQTIK
eukprot:293533-Chlamydomonas_euryale.AAC.11